MHRYFFRALQTADKLRLRAWLVALALGCGLPLAGWRALAWQAPADAQTAAEPAVGQAKIRLFEQDPYDEIVLDDEFKTVIQVLPLELPGRKVPENRKDFDKLIVRKTDEPTQEYELLWGDIAEVRFFEQLVLEEARALVNADKFDEAYDYFDFLKRNHAQMEGLDAALAAYLYKDAEAWQRRGKYENALALLNELHAVRPQYPNLPVAMGAATDKLVEQHMGASDFRSGRRLVETLAARFPGHPVAQRWSQRWQAEAAELLTGARARMEAGELHEAWAAGMHVLDVWPTLPSAQAFFDELYQRYPRVTVGVTMPAGAQPGSRLVDWSSRRSSRLLHRLLVEFESMSAQGGQYACPLGELSKPDLGARLVFQLRRGIRWPGTEAGVTGIDVARRLVDLADPAHPDCQLDWAQLFAGVEVRDVYEVAVDLNWSHVRPEGMLQTPLFPASSIHSAGAIGPYLVAQRDAGQVRYVASPEYFASEPTSPKEIIERYFGNSRQAVAALKQGRIQVLDRVNPWDVEPLQSDGQLVVDRYALPTLICLLPNLNRPFTASPSFRRALVYGINRQLILDRHLLRGRQMPGCQVISGPFPAGLGFDDPLRYAYNALVEPRTYDPQLAIALSGVALAEINVQAKAKGQAELAALPALVLAHPPHDTAREACEAIQKHLKAIKIAVELVELAPGVVAPPGGDYDLVYAEIVVDEPVVDARRLLGPDGILGGASPYMGLALRHVDQAANWKQASQRLQEIHRLAADDVAVIPLWQMIEHFAYRKSLEGIGSRPVLLYQFVERWRGKFQVPTETP
ncbi:MAG: ABC transporter substrate-binding protein [Pirellulales bacterium]